MAAKMHIKLINRGEEGELLLEGRLDSTTAPEVEEIVLQMVDRFDKIILNMAQLEYISSAGLRVLKLLYMALRKKAVRAASGSMRSSASKAAVSHYAYKNQYGALALLFILSAVLLFVLGENLMFFIPLTCAAVAMIMYHITGLKFWLPAALFVILLHAFSFLYALSMALTIGAVGAVMMLAFLDFMVLIPMADLYLIQTKK